MAEVCTQLLSALLLFLINPGYVAIANGGVCCRDGSVTAPGGPTAMPQEESRSQIDEQHIPKLGGPTYKDVKPKTYQVLEEQLQSGDTQPAAAAGKLRTFLSV